MKVSVGAGKKAIVWLVAIVFMIAAAVVSFTAGGAPAVTAETQTGGEATARAASAVGVDVSYSGSTYNYTDFHSAWNKAVSLGGSSSSPVTIKLNQDVKVSKTSTVASGKYITINLNGYTIDRGLRPNNGVTDGSRMFHVNGGYLRITDTSSGSTVGKLTGCVFSPDTVEVDNKYGALALITNKGTLEFVRGIMTGNYATDSPCVWVNGNGTFNMKGGEISGNVAYHTGGALQIGGWFEGVSNTECYLKISGGTIKNNRTQKQYDGGAIMLRKGANADIRDCEISGNICTGVNGGGAICVESGVTLTLNNVTFKDNTAEVGNGGAINSASPVTAVGCTFINNKTSVFGGAIYAPAVTATNCTFTNNSAEQGGAIFCNGNITFTGSTFDGNSALSRGGAFSDEDAGVSATRTVDTCTFNNNTAGEGGGAMCIRKDITFSGRIEFNNNSAGIGGAVYYRLLGNIVRADNATGEVIFNGNSATNNGGAMYIDASWDNNGQFTRTIVLKRGFKFTSNRAAANGGAIYIVGNKTTTTFDMRNVTMTDNVTERGNGGGIYLKDISILKMSDFTANGNEAALSGGALYDDHISANVNRLTVTANNIIADGNKALGGSGGAFRFYDYVYLAGGITGNFRFTNNSATADGGAIYANSAFDWSKATAYFKGNSAGGSGGAVYGIYGTSDKDGSYINGTFESNTAGTNGGAIDIRGHRALIKDAVFKYNTAAVGGAVSIASHVLNLESTTFTENTAVDGGAIAVVGAGQLIMSAAAPSTFTRNSTTSHGGAMYIAADYTDKYAAEVYADFTGNSSVDGGAIYVSGSPIYLASGINTGNTASNKGGVLYAVNSDVRSNGFSVDATNTAAAGGNGYYARDGAVISITEDYDGNAANNKTLTLSKWDSEIRLGRNSYVAIDKTKSRMDSTPNFRLSYDDPDAVAIVLRSGKGVSNLTSGGHRSLFSPFDAEYCLQYPNSDTAKKSMLLGRTAVEVTSTSMNEKFTSFKDAWENNAVVGASATNHTQSENLTVKLVRDISLRGIEASIDSDYTNSVFKADKGYVTVDLNGHTLDRGGEVGRIFYVLNGGFLIVKDSSGNNSGKMTGGDVSADLGNGKGQLMIGGLVSVNGKSTFELHSGTLCGGKAGHGGAVALFNPNGSKDGSQSTFRMRGGVIENNWARNRGGAIYADKYGYVRIDAGFVTDNSSGGDGGAIYMTARGDMYLRVKDCELLRNSAAGSGGGIYYEADNEWKIYTSRIRNNTAGRRGGGIYSKGKLVLTDNYIEYNTASDGGALCMSQGASTNLEANFLELNGYEYIRGNSADYGGAMCFYGSSTEQPLKYLINGELEGNTATYNGGAIALYGNVDAQVKAYITENTANNGGGIYASGDRSSKLVLNEAYISDNTANKEGGGIWSYRTSVEIQKGGVNSNIAGYGAGIYACDADLIIGNGNIYGNISSFNGGGIYLNSSNCDYIIGSITGNTASRQGGGIYVDNGGKLTINNANPTISGNKRGADAADETNIYVNRGAMSVAADLAAEARVSVAVRSVPFAITRANDNVTLNAENFVSENTQYTFEQLYDGNLALGEAQFTVTFNGTSVKTHFLDTAFHYAASYETTEADRAIVEMGRDGIFYKQEHITVPASAHVTLMMNGYNITAAFATAPQYGGAFYVEGDLRVENGFFTNCVAADEGAAIYATLKSKLEMYDVEFSANNTVATGENSWSTTSAVFVGMHLVMENCVFRNHKSKCVNQKLNNYNDAWFYNNYVRINNCEFVGNENDCIFLKYDLQNVSNSECSINVSITNSGFYNNGRNGLIVEAYANWEITYKGKIDIDGCKFENSYRNRLFQVRGIMVEIDESDLFDCEVRNCDFINNAYYEEIRIDGIGAIIENTNFSGVFREYKRSFISVEFGIFRNLNFIEDVTSESEHWARLLLMIVNDSITGIRNVVIENIKHTVTGELNESFDAGDLIYVNSRDNTTIEINGLETNSPKLSSILQMYAVNSVCIRNINIANCTIHDALFVVDLTESVIIENISVRNCIMERFLFISRNMNYQLNNIEISNNVFLDNISQAILFRMDTGTYESRLNDIRITNNHFTAGSAMRIENDREWMNGENLTHYINIYLSGNIVIEENYTGCTIDENGKVTAIGKEQNVTASLLKDKTHSTNIYTSQLSPTSRIGITPWESPAIGQKSLIAQSTPGSLALAGNFFSDDANYMLAQDGSDVVLVPYTKAAVGAVVEWKSRTYNYGDFDSAFAFAGALDTTAADPAVVRPLWDATTRGCYLDAGRYVTVDLNGYSIDRGSAAPITDGYGFIVLGGLKITDSRGGGVITGGNNLLYGGAFLVTAGGSLTIEGGTITGNSADMGGGVYVAAGGRLAVNGGIIENNSANYGGGIYAAEDSAVTVSGGEVRRNSALYGGGAYLLGSMSVTGDAKISGNETDDVYLLSGRSITVTGTLAPTAVIGVATEAVPHEFADVEIARAAEGVTITDGAFVGKYAVITDGSRALLSVNGVTMVGLDVVFDSGAETVFDTTQLEELRNYLTVKGKMSDGTVTDAVTDYTLMLDPTKDGLTVGENELTVLYKGRLEKIKIEVKKFAIVEIAANYIQGEDVIYSNEDAGRLAELLGDKLTVIGKTVEGVETRLYDYTLTLAGGATEFVAGENTIVVTFGEITGEFIVNVTELYLASITAETTGAIYDGATLDDVRARLKVTGEMNDGSRYFGDVSYTLEILGAEALAVGNNSVRVMATDGSKTCTTDITVVVTAIRISEITVTFDQGETVVYTSATMDALKTALAAQITISGKRNNGEEVASVTEYTLSTASGKLVLGQNVVTVTAEDATATIMVTATGVEVTSITVSYAPNGATIYTSNTLESLRQYLTVGGVNNDGTTTESMTEYTLAYAEGATGLVVGENTITVKADKLTETFKVTAAAVEATGITASFAQGETVIYTSDEVNGEKIRALTTVTINYNDGSAVETQGYTLTGSLTAGTVSLTATLDDGSGMTATVENVTVTEVALAEIKAAATEGAKFYEGDTLESVKGRITLSGVNNDGSAYVGELSEFTLELPDGATALAVGANTVTVRSGAFETGIELTADEIDLAGIKATFTQGEIVVYASAAEADIKGLIASGLEVVGINNNGSETDNIADYEVNIKFGSALVLGQNILTVTYRGYTAEIVLVTSAVAQSGITAAYDAGENKVYTSAALDSLLGYVTVTGVNNDGSTFAIAAGYRLEFKSGAASLTAGVNTLAVVYKEFTADIEVTAAAVELTSIEAVYDGTGITVYESVAIGSLKGAIGSGLTVTGRYNDGSSAELEDYTLSVVGDALTAGANEVTVTVGVLTAKITVTAEAVLLDRIEAVFRPGVYPIYESSTLSDLIPYLTVKGYNNDGSETAAFEITAEMLSIVQTGENVFAAGENTVTVTVEGKTAQFMVTAAAVKLEEITVNFDQTGITVYEGLALDDIKEKIKSGLTVNGKYNNGTELNGITDYTISLEGTAEALVAGSNAVYVSYGGKFTSITVTATAIALDNIMAAFDFTGKAYTSTTLDSLKPYVTVTGVNNDGSAYTGDTSAFTLSLESGATTLAAGTNRVTVTFKGKTYMFNVYANNVALERLEVAFDAAGAKVYTSTSLESLRNYLTVKGYNNDGSRYSGDMSTYTLSIGFGDTNAIFEGENEVTVGYGGITARFTVIAEKVKVDALSATFDQTNIKVYTSATVEGLKGIISDGLAVTGTMNDGTTVENMADYTLSLKVGDKLMLGQNIITVSYGDTSCDIIVVVSAVELESIEVSADFGRDTLYTSADEATLRGYLTVNGINNDGTKEEGVTGYTLTLPAGGLADGNNELTVAYKGKTAKVTVAATAVAISRLDAKFDQGEARIYTNDAVNGDKIRGMITLTVYYNDGTSEVTQDYTVTGSLTEGTVSLTATLNFDATRTAAIDGVRVMGVTLERIEAAYENSGTVYVSADINSLKKYIRLTGVNNDGSAYAGSLSEFTLSFAEGKTALEAGENVLTVSFDDGYGMVTTTVTITAEAVTVSRITVTFTQGDIVVYTSATAESLKTDIADVTTVTAIYTDGSTAVTADYTLAFNGALTMGQNVVTVNYEGASATIMVSARAVALESVSVEFEQGATVVYTSATADSLKAQLANLLKVTGNNNDGSKIEDVAEYLLVFAGDKLTAGSNTVTVSYGGKTAHITVTATAVALESIAVEFEQGQMKIYTSATAESLKTQLANVLTVTGKNNDGSDYGEITEYTLSFAGSALSVGVNTVTVSYGGKDATFDVSAIQATIVDIEASYDAGGDTVYTSAALESLKKYIKVTGIAADGIRHTLAEGYTLSVAGGALAEGNNTVTITYEGLIYDITVAAVGVKIVGIDAEYAQGESVIYTSANVSELKGIVEGLLKVSARYNDGSVVEDIVEYTVALKSGSALLVGQNILTVSYDGVSADIVLNVSAVELARIEAAIDLNGISVFTSTEVSALAQYVTVTGINNDGSRVENIAEFGIAGKLNAGANVLTVSYAGKTTTVEVTAEAVAAESVSVEFAQNESVIYASDDVNGAKIRALATVTVIYNDGTRVVTEDYAISGELTEGNATLSVTLTENAEISATFDAAVTAVALESITAELKYDGTIYTSTPLESLKEYITIKGINNDGSAYAGGFDGYVLTVAGDTLAAGANEVTVTYGGISATFNVDAVAVTPSRIEAEYVQGEEVIAAGISAEELLTLIADKITLKVFNNDGSEYAGEMAFTLEIKYGATLVGGNNIVIVNAEGMTDEVVVNAYAGNTYTKLDVTVDASGTIYTSTPLSGIRKYLTVTLDGEPITGYELTYSEGETALKAGVNTVIVKYADASEAVEIDVTAVEIAEIKVTTPPAKVNYTAYETLATEGMTVIAVYNDGSTSTLTEYGIVYTGGNDSLRYGETGATVRYADGERVFTAVITGINVARIVVARPTVTGDYRYSGETQTAAIAQQSCYSLSGSLSAKNAGAYTATATLTDDNYAWEDTAERSVEIAWTIEKAAYDMTGVAFESVEFVQDGANKSLEISGTLPSGVTVEYTGNAHAEAGVYTVTAKFTGDSVNYEPIADMTATLTIKAKQMGGADSDVIVDSEDGLHPDYTLDVKDVTGEENEGVDLGALGGNPKIEQSYDVALKNGGVAVTPDKSVTVKLLISEELRGRDDLKVYYVSDTGALTDMHAVRDGNYMVFETKLFSRFIIVGEGEAVFEPSITEIAALAGGGAIVIVLGCIAVALGVRRRRFVKEMKK